MDVPKPDYPQINFSLPTAASGLLIAAITFIATIGGIVVLIATGISSPGTYETYVPKFNSGKIEYVYGGAGGARLYLKTSDKYNEGDIYPGLTFITASRLNNKDQYDILDDRIDEIKDGYVVFHLGPSNPDCFAVYKDKEFISDISKTELGLPAPNDKWMCQGFDFANALKK